ncbi:MAG: hypothetical protein ACXWDL_06570, partial [Nocardioides sp.]
MQTGTPAAPLGITRPTDDHERLARATATILGDLDRHRLTDPEAALTAAQARFLRLAEAEIKEAATRAYSEATKRSPRVTGWRRGLKSGRLPARRWWSRGG